MDARVCWLFIAMAAGSATDSAYADTAIYRCTVNGTTTFSDRPCSDDAQPVTLDTSRVSTFTPVPAGNVKASRSTRSKPRRKAAPSAGEGRCVSIRSGLHKIDDQLRAGYTAKEGIRLDARKRTLRQQARELKC